MTFTKLCFFQGSEISANAGEKQEEHRKFSPICFITVGSLVWEQGRKASAQGI